MKWQLTLQVVSAQSARLGDAARHLLSGHPVDTSDTTVQSSWLPEGPGRGRLRLLDADVSVVYGLEIHMTALQQNEILALGRTAAAGIAAPVPAAWIVVEGPTGRRWRLFNCRIRLVKICRA